MMVRARGRRTSKRHSGQRPTARKPLEKKQVLGLQILFCGLLLLAVLTLQRLDTPAAREAYGSVKTALTRNVTVQDMKEGLQTAWETVQAGGASVLTAVREAGTLRLTAPADGDAVLAASVNAAGQDTGNMLVYTPQNGELQVYAAAGGTVLETMDLGEGAFLIRISHGNDAITDYQGTGRIYTKPFEKVKKGQLIAAATGDLFFSLSMDGVPANPQDYLR